MKDQVTALKIRTVDRDQWHESFRGEKAIREFGQLDTYTLAEASRWIDTDTRELTFFLVDQSNGEVFEVSADSFYKLLSWKLAGDGQLLFEYLNVWTNQAERSWKVVQIPTIFNNIKYAEEV